jgi:hypothetical protein
MPPIIRKENVREPNASLIPIRKYWPPEQTRKIHIIFAGYCSVGEAAAAGSLRGLAISNPPRLGQFSKWAHGWLIQATLPNSRCCDDAADGQVKSRLLRPGLDALLLTSLRAVPARWRPC